MAKKPCIYTLKDGRVLSYDEMRSYILEEGITLEKSEEAKTELKAETKAKEETGEKKKESKFNIRQRLGIPENEALADLANKDRLMYQVDTNKEQLKRANEFIEKNGFDNAYEFATASEGSPTLSTLVDRFAVGGRLISVLENGIKNAKNDTDKQALIEALDDLRKAIQTMATQSGQAVQALSTVGNIMPKRDAAVAMVNATRAKAAEDAKDTDVAKTETDVKNDKANVVNSTIEDSDLVKGLQKRIEELEAQIAAKKTQTRRETVKKVTDAIRGLKIGGAKADPFLASTVYNNALELVAISIEKGASLAEAIEKGVRYIKAKVGNKQWDEKGFRDSIENSIDEDTKKSIQELYDKKKALTEARQKTKDATRKGLETGDFGDLEDLLAEKGMKQDEIDAKVKRIKEKFDADVLVAVSKRIEKNLGFTPKTEKEKSLVAKMAKEEPLTDAEKIELAKKKLGLEDLTEKQEAKLKELYDETERVALDIDLFNEAYDKLRHEAQKLVPRTLGEKLINYYDSIIYYPNILSSPVTLATNTIDAFLANIGFNALFRKGGLESFKDQFKGYKIGYVKGRIGIEEGFLRNSAYDERGLLKKDISYKTAEDYAKEGSKIAKYYSVWVGRAMALPNIFGEAKRFATLSNIIQGSLRKQGLKGQELIDKKNELLYGTEAMRESFKPKAIELVYGSEKARNAKKTSIQEAKVIRTLNNMVLAEMQKKLESMGEPNALQAAQQLVDDATYQNTARGVLGLAPFIQKQLQNIKGGTVIDQFLRKIGGLEFLNTAANIINQKANYLPPVGYMRAYNKSTSRGIDALTDLLWKSRFFEENIGYNEKRSEEERLQILQKANVGMAFAVLIGAGILKGLSSDDEDDRIITGDLSPQDYLGNRSKYIKQKMTYKSLKPYSIKLPVIGWTNYNLTPFSSMFALMGNISDHLHYLKDYDEITEKGVANAFVFGTAKTLKSIAIDQSPLKSLVDRYKSTKNTDVDNTHNQFLDYMSVSLANTVGANVPNFIKAMAKQIDATQYTPKTFSGKIAKATGALNMASALGIEVNQGYAVDILGEKIYAKSGERNYNYQLAEPLEENKHLYDLFYKVYGDPMNYPNLLDSKTPFKVDETKREDLEKQLEEALKLYKEGKISATGLANREAKIEKNSVKITEIGNDPLIYSEAVETIGEIFREKLNEDYNEITNETVRIKQMEKINNIYKEAKKEGMEKMREIYNVEEEASEEY